MAKAATLSQRALVELIATFMFVFLGAGSAIGAYLAYPAMPALLIAAAANGIALALAISFAMNISGGHVNPAVTIGLFVARKIGGKDAIVYIFAQLLGAVLAGVLLVGWMPTAAGMAVHYGSPALGPSVSIGQAIALEAVATFFLVMMVFGTAVDKRAPKIAGFGVGLVVAVEVLVIGPLTGAAMNPARAMGPMIASMFLAHWYVYWIGPVIGAVTAALVYKNCILNKN